MKTAIRTFVAVIAALTLALILLAGVELFVEAVYPLPQGAAATYDEICKHVAAYPTWILVVVIPMWSGIVFGCTFLAKRIGNQTACIVVAAILGVALMANVIMLPYELWFKVVALSTVPEAGFLGWFFSGGMRRLITPAETEPVSKTE